MLGCIPEAAGVWEPTFPWDASTESSFSLAAPELQLPATPDVPSITSPRAAGAGREVPVPLHQPRAPMAVTVTVAVSSAGVLGPRDLAGRPNIPKPSEARGAAAAHPALAAALGAGGGDAGSPCPDLTRGMGSGPAPWSAAAPARPPGGWGTAPVPQRLRGGLMLSSCRHGALKNSGIQKLQEEASVPRDLAQVVSLTA